MFKLAPLLLMAVACKPDAQTWEVNADLSQSVHSAMDESADPCVDFQRFACGEWIDNTELPPDRPQKVRSFSTIQDKNEELLQSLMEQAQSDAEAGAGDAGWQQVGAYYGACMDTEYINTAGIDAFQPMFDAIDAMTTESFAGTLGTLHRSSANPLFATGVETDFKNPNIQYLMLTQAGLGLPDRSYYLGDDERMVAIRAGYVTHITTMLTLLGASEEIASDHAAKILELETKLADMSLQRAQLHDPALVYNPTSLGQLAEDVSGFDWAAYLQALGADVLLENGAIKPKETVVVSVPDFIKGAVEVAEETDIELMKTYLRWHYLSGHAHLLSAEFDDENFDFYSRQLTGTEAQRPRWKRCISATTDALGDEVSKAYINEAFAGESKDIALEMIGYIQEAFRANLPALTWMDDETRAGAVDKLDKFTKKIGYPDKWEDYSSIEVGESYAQNALNANAFGTSKMLAKINAAPDPDEWFMPASVVNAYYHPLMNEMVFPAGILQAPMFDKDFPMAMNLGGIGMVIGHELTHGFDDDGRKFNGDGEMKDWWNESAIERFEEATQCVEDAYNGYEIREGLMVDGELTLGENIADLGGIKQSLLAYRAWVADNGPEPQRVEGLTNEQLLFVNFAQGWCSVAKPEYETMMATVDSHSPPRFRINGPVSHTAEFSEVFECDEGAPMNLVDRCEVW